MAKQPRPRISFKKKSITAAACDKSEQVDGHGVEPFKTGKGNTGIMKATRITVKWERGLHLRAAARLVRLARQFRSRILVRLGSQVADARSIMSIMILAASLGTSLLIEASGEDEHEAIQAVVAYFDGGTAND